MALDIETLQKYTHEEKKEFVEFTTTVTKSFVSVQENFEMIQNIFCQVICYSRC